MAENLRSETQNAVHSDANHSEKNQSDETLINVNFSEVSEDRKPILSLLPNVSKSMAQSSNVSESLSNSDSTPDNKGWFLYRPRTRSAKKKLLFAEVVVISSDSEGSEVECTHNSYVTEIVLKKEKISDDPPPEEAAISVVTVTDKSEVFEEQRIMTGNCDEPLESDMKCARNSNVTEIILKKEKISDDPPLEETAVSVVTVTDKSELLEEQRVATGKCIEPLGSDMKCAHNSNVTEIVTKKEVFSDDAPFEKTAVSDVTVADNSDLIEEHGVATVTTAIDNSELLEEQGIATGTTITDKSEMLEEQGIATGTTATDNSELLEKQGIVTGSTITDKSEVLEEQEIAIGTTATDNSELLEEQGIATNITVTDKSEMLQEQRITTDNYVEPLGSDMECARSSCVKEVVMMKEVISDPPLDDTAVSDVNVTENSKLLEFFEEQGIVTVTDNSELLEEEGIVTGNCVEPQSSDLEVCRDSNVTEIETNKMGISDDAPFEETAVSDVTVSDHSELLDLQEFATGSCGEAHQPSISPLKVPSVENTSPLEIRQNLKSSCSYDTYSTQPVTDNIIQAKNILLSADQSYDNSQVVEDNSCETDATETVIDGPIESKRNVWSERSTTYGFSQSVEHNSTDRIGQSERKDNLCECSTCSKCVNVFSSVDDIIRQLKPKCLQFERECESNANDSIVKLIEGTDSSTPASEPVTNTARNSMNDANSTGSDLEDSPVQRLEWSSDLDVHSDGEISDDSFRNSNDSESMHKDQNVESNDCFMICKDEYAIHSANDDSIQISNGEKSQNEDNTENTDVVNSSDDQLLDKLDHRTDKKYCERLSMSDDELVTSGRYGAQVKNESIDVLTSFTIGRLNSMDEGMLRAIVVAVPDFKKENAAIVGVEDHTSKPSVSPKSQDDVLSVEQLPYGSSEYEREYGQRPPERDDKLLARLKRKRSAAKLICLAESTEKRKRIERTTATESDSDTEQIQRKKRTHRQPKKSSHKVIERVAGLFQKVSKNLREKRKKMKAKLSRKRKSFTKMTDNFVVTPYREDKVVESMKGFVIVPDRRCIENEDV